MEEQQRGEHGNNSLSYDFFMEQNFDKSIRILEIGCNLGTLTYQLFQAGYTNIQGIDVTELGILTGKEKYPLIKEKINLYSGDTLPFANETFDLVMSYDVLEHIPDTHQHLGEVNRVLKKGGKYIGQTPNKFTNIPREIINTKSFTKWKTYHCSLQTLSSLKKVFETNGFQIDSITKRNIVNDFNMQRVRDKLGPPGVVLLKIVNNLPLQLQTNFRFISHKN